MRLFARKPGTTNRLVGTTVLALTLAVGAHAGTAQSAQPTGADLQAWHTTMTKVPRPSAKGCFTANYPQQEWQETKCATAPSIPMVPKPGPRPLVIGNGNDISAQAPSGRISETNGTFENIVNVTSVESPIGNTGPAVADAYTLQINTNFMTTPACAGSSDPAQCQGWEQFVFANDPTSVSYTFIQYWLLLFNNPCPAGWTTFSFTGSTDIYCYRNSAAVIVPNQPIGNLGTLRLTGEATAAGDGVTFTAGMTAYNTPGGNYINASGEWTISEFNIFGYGGNSDGGGSAVFNAGASVHVRTRINYGGTDAPNCVAQGFTGETNNLNFGLPKPPRTGPGPAVIFKEDTTGGATPNCAAGEVIGDTHQLTFAGLAYDFQASGDFVEAQVGTGFEVQTRKVSGAPTWPGTSVNQSVATKMGNTKVALCDSKRLVVDGRTQELQPGGVLALPSGVTIHRLGNVYYVVDTAGNSITVTFNPGYVDVNVGLGTWPVKVRGLLGNPDGDVKRLEAKDGTQFDVPISFDDLYRKFGDSWRVSPLRTLLAPCGQVASGNPSAPFFADDLNPDLRQRAEGICRQAKVTEAWLDFCTLDVAVIGEKAAHTYIGMEPPVLIGNP
jgi:hypothetical protein